MSCAFSVSPPRHTEFTTCLPSREVKLPPIQRLSFEIRVTSGDVIWPFDDVWHASSSSSRRYFRSVISVLSAGTWKGRCSVIHHQINKDSSRGKLRKCNVSSWASFPLSTRPDVIYDALPADIGCWDHFGPGRFYSGGKKMGPSPWVLVASPEARNSQVAESRNICLFFLAISVLRRNSILTLKWTTLNETVLRVLKPKTVSWTWNVARIDRLYGNE